MRILKFPLKHARQSETAWNIFVNFFAPASAGHMSVVSHSWEPPPSPLAIPRPVKTNDPLCCRAMAVRWRRWCGVSHHLVPVPVSVSRFRALPVPSHHTLLVLILVDALRLNNHVKKYHPKTTMYYRTQNPCCLKVKRQIEFETVAEGI